MRTDARIDRKQVLLPHLVGHTLGFDKWKAQFGDVVMFHYGNINNNHEIGRVAGRIAYAPSIEPGEQPIENWLLIIAFSHDMTHVMERWINPSQVVRCYTPTVKQRDLYECMMSKDFTNESPDTLREWATTGYSTIDEWKGARQ